MSSVQAERRSSTDSADEPATPSSHTTDNVEDVEIINLDDVTDETVDVVEKTVDGFGDGYKESGETVGVEDGEEDDEQVSDEEEEQKELDQADKMDKDGIFEGLTAEERDEVFTPQHQSSAIHNLVIGSVLMFTLPCLVMYCTYRFLFLDHYHMETDKAALYSGILGVATVYVIVIGFVYIAYKEEKQISERVKAIKSR